ncbi:hypothetical protein [Flavobacterium sp.]|uniref:hypothetical protein n=1 Tax=Flavobacterium sp. TaxID=239 RepID=UPI0040476CBD
MNEQEKAIDLIREFESDAFELTEIKIRELKLELKYWEKVLEEIGKNSSIKNNS